MENQNLINGGEQEIMFTNIKISNQEIKNRIVRSATNDHLGNKDGTVSDKQIELYHDLASNNIGLIITGHICVSEKNRADETQSLVSDDKYISGLKRISDEVHKHQSVVYGQISHAGIKGYLNPVDFNDLSIDEIDTIIQQFISGAKRLEQAGFDGVQIHIAHGYFLAGVLDNTVNLRNDLYGDSDENRIRMISQIIQGIKIACSDSFGVIVKMSANNQQLSDYDTHLLYYANALKQLGVDAIELSGSDFFRKDKDETVYYLKQALLIKENIDIPVILVGGINSVETINEVLNKGIDMVALARTFIVESDFITKIMNGTKKSKCLHCNQCFVIFKTKFKNCVFLKENEQLANSFKNKQ